MAAARWSMRCSPRWRDRRACALAEPGEFTRRAFANGRIDLTEAEGLPICSRRRPKPSAAPRWRWPRAGSGARSSSGRQRLVELSARAEAAIDYVDDEDETAADEAALADDAQALADELGEWLARPRDRAAAGRRAGRRRGPAERRKIQPCQCDSRRATGHRHRYLRAPRATLSRCRWRSAACRSLLVDTAGLRDTDDAVEAHRSRPRARAQIAGADILLWLGEPGDGARRIRALISVHAAGRSADRASPPQGSLAVSAVTGAGLGELVAPDRRGSAAIAAGEDAMALNRRQAARAGGSARAALRRRPRRSDLVLAAEASAAGARRRSTG